VRTCGTDNTLKKCKNGINGGDMNIRKACINDFIQINELFWQSDLYHYRNEPYIYEKTNEGHRTEEYFKSLIEDENNVFIVLEKENKII